MDDILKEIGHLPLAERMLLAHAIIDSAIAEMESVPVSAEQLAELRRRAAAIDAGEVKCLPWEEVRKHLFTDQ